MKPQEIVMLSTDGKIHFSCNECGTKYVATTHQAGKPGNCKNCDSPISVPFLEEAEESKTVAYEVKFCPECGSSLRKDAIFCNNCGASLIQKTIPKAAQIKREETWNSTRKKYGLTMKYFYAIMVIAVFVIGIYFKSPAINNSASNSPNTKATSTGFDPYQTSSIVSDKFVDKNVSFSQDDISDYVWTKGIGEIINNSGKSYKQAFFDFNIYDADKKLVGVRPIIINNFRKGQTKSFSCDFEGIYARDIKSYSIDFSSGY